MALAGNQDGMTDPDLMSSQISAKSNEIIQNAQHVIRKNSGEDILRGSNTGTVRSNQQF